MMRKAGSVDLAVMRSSNPPDCESGWIHALVKPAGLRIRLDTCARNRDLLRSIFNETRELRWVLDGVEFWEFGHQGVLK